jgi:hypothetical protein
MLRNTQIASVETLEGRTLFSASSFGVADLHEQFNVQHTAIVARKSHSSESAAEAKAAKQAIHQAALAAKKAALEAKQAQLAAAKAAKQAAKQAAKNPVVTPVAPVAPAAPAEPVALPEPGLSSAGYHYAAFATEPLFSGSGPSENDIAQGQIGDCYFLSTLSAVAKTDPNLIRQSVTELSNGDFQVAFHSNGQTVDEVVDDKLAVASNGQPVYAQLGQGGCLWVAIMEKAFCAFYGNNTYNSISGGWMDSVFAALGATPTDIMSATSGAALLSSIQSELTAGEAVTIAINQPADGAPLVGDHAYTVDSIGTDGNGNLTLTVRNPWGFAGVGANPFGSAYVTLTAQQAIDSMIGVVAAFV